MPNYPPPSVHVPHVTYPDYPPPSVHVPYDGGGGGTGTGVATVTADVAPSIYGQMEGETPVEYIDRCMVQMGVVPAFAGNPDNMKKTMALFLHCGAGELFVHVVKGWFGGE